MNLGEEIIFNAEWNRKFTIYQNASEQYSSKGVKGIKAMQLKEKI